MFYSADGEVIKSFTQDTWDKDGTIIEWLLDEISQALDDRPTLNFKRLESVAGYTCHLSMTHEGFCPILIEIYLTLNSRRSQQDEDGWKVLDKLLNYSHSRIPPCAPSRTHGQIQAPGEPTN
jgi:hypothetical protein